MRKNYTYNAKEPQNRNELIDMLKNKEDVIVLGNNLLEELAKEINENIKSGKKGRFFSKMALPIVLLSWNPVGWFLAGTELLFGTILKAGDSFKKYNIYQGNDVCLRQILTLHLKDSVDLKYDKVIYPDWVGKIEYKKVKRIK